MSNTQKIMQVPEFTDSEMEELLKVLASPEDGPISQQMEALVDEFGRL